MPSIRNDPGNSLEIKLLNKKLYGLLPPALANLHHFHLTKRFPKTHSTIQPIGTPSAFCINQIVPGFVVYYLNSLILLYEIHVIVESVSSFYHISNHVVVKKSANLEFYNSLNVITCGKPEYIKTACSFQIFQIVVEKRLNISESTYLHSSDITAICL